MESPAERDLIARMTRQEPEALRDFQAAYTPLLRYIIAPILPRSPGPGGMSGGRHPPGLGAHRPI